MLCAQSHLTTVYGTETLVSPEVVFRVERIAFLCLSLILDYSVYRLVPTPSARIYALVLLASSYIVHTFQTRPFSNSIEAVLFAIFLVTFQNVVSPEKRSSARVSIKGILSLTYLAFLLAFGIYTRLTFIAFALPVVLETLKWTVRRATQRADGFSVFAWGRLVTIPLTVAILTVLCMALVDTAYFRGEYSAFVVTPLNFLLYNLSLSNLEEHGLHPRWLHGVVNMPMILGPGLLYYAVLAGLGILKLSSKKQTKARLGVAEILKRTCFYTIFAAPAILSVQPHQEPRFLIPLLVPAVVLVSLDGRILRAGKLFWVSWIVANVFLMILFGVLHQGGVVPSLFRLHDRIRARGPDGQFATLNIVYWKTYMPPRHLLAVPEKHFLSGRITFADLAGTSLESFAEHLLSHSDTDNTVLVAPFYAVPPQLQRCFVEQTRVFPHLDLDHIGETVELGWRDGLSLGIFDVDVECVRERAV
ncbi:GPI mannosyltransferase 4 [Grifola frondosa]|uniref:Mannosyltransferase n=1 Tax=Grifola frondosa TaxID=5627 RepID=A0A1C7MKJ0_GRIFR|nr:GPI mannosyltransferase 4 [Grifola frondosa]